MSIYKGTTLIAGLPDVTGKADIDLGNLSNAGSIIAGKMSMPSSVYDDLTLPTSGSSVSAPSDGYFRLNGGATTGNKFVSLSGNRLVVSSTSVSGVVDASVILPVKKGDSVQVSYSADTSLVFLFVYAEGSKSEAA